MPRKSSPPLFSVTRVPINRGGYDPLGTYYGIGAPVWRFQQDAHESDTERFAYLVGTVRAPDRGAACAYVERTYPDRKPRFYRRRSQRAHAPR